VVTWEVRYHKRINSHLKNLKAAGLIEKAKKVAESIEVDPFSTSHSFEKLVGKLKGYYSKRINIKHRLVYSVDTATQIVYIYSMWSHYENV